MSNINISAIEETQIKESIKNFEPKYRTVLIQRRKHKKWRTNKKWAKRYGFDEVETIHPEYQLHVFQVLDDILSNKIIFDFSNFVDIKDIHLGDRMVSNVNISPPPLKD